MRVVLLGTMWALSAFPASQPVRETFTQAVTARNQRIAKFRHGYLVALEPGNGPANGISAFAPDGTLAFEKVVELPSGGSHSSVADVDFDADGNGAVAASAFGTTPCMLHGVLLWIAPGGKPALSTRAATCPPTSLSHRTIRSGPLDGKGIPPVRQKISKTT